MFFRCVDVDAQRFANIFLFNETILHLVDDIFWHMGFRSAEHVEKVMSQIVLIVITVIIVIILIISGQNRQ